MRRTEDTDMESAGNIFDAYPAAISPMGWVSNGVSRLFWEGFKTPPQDPPWHAQITCCPHTYVERKGIIMGQESTFHCTRITKQANQGNIL